MLGDVGSNHPEGCEEGSKVISKLGGKRATVGSLLITCGGQTEGNMADKPLEWILQDQESKSGGSRIKIPGEMLTLSLEEYIKIR